MRAAIAVIALVVCGCSTRSCSEDLQAGLGGGDASGGDGAGGRSGQGGAAGGGAIGGMGTGGFGMGGDGGSGGMMCTADLQNDPDNCGACDHSCQGGTCVAAQCQPVELANAVAPVWFVLRDRTFLYFVHPNPGFIQRVSATMPGSITPLGVGESGSGNIIFSYIAVSEPSMFTVGIMTGLLTGSSEAAGVLSDVYATVPAGIGPLAVRGNELFWGVFDGTLLQIDLPTAAASDGTLIPNDINHSVPLLATTHKFSDIDVTSSEIVWSEAQIGGNDCGIEGQVHRYSALTAIPLSSLLCSVGVAISGSSVYWTDLEGGVLMRNTLTGMPADETVVAPGPFVKPWDVAADDSHAYLVEYGTGAADGAIWRVDQQTLETERLADGQVGPRYVALDDCCAYWGTEDGRLMKVAK